MKVVPTLFFFSGLTSLIYESVWIRHFSIGFGQTSEALGTVLAAFLGGLALGSWLAGRIADASPGRCLSFYGVAEILTGAYALAVPLLVQATQPLLRIAYGSGQEAIATTAVLRALLCSAILVPPAILMGASLPLLAGQSKTRGPSSIQWLYAVNLAGASTGALLSAFLLLPAWGFTRTLQIASILNFAVGAAALWAATSRTAPEAAVNPGRAMDAPPLRTLVWMTVAFGSGGVCMLHEVAWGRVYGILLGPTASTVSLVLGVFLVGLTAGSLAGRKLRNSLVWLCAAQFACAALLLWAFAATGAVPPRIAGWVRGRNQSELQIELMKAAVLIATLFPMTLAIGLNFPLIMRIAPVRELPFARRIGGALGVNTIGCIAGALGTGWLLIPALGTQRTLLLGGLSSVALGALLSFHLPRAWPARASAVALILASLAVPRWNMSEMTAGGYKYALYYEDPPAARLNRGDPLFLHEGVFGTVAVRQDGPSRLLSIDGKVDASDAGGDLLTEKLLAHPPLLLKRDATSVCLIGLASGVTAAAVLTYPVQSLEVVEVSPDVVKASHFFDGVNRTPLADRRTALVMNDGRNHLALTSRQYDVIVSEPSNPWMAGMNNLFTRDFFRIAKQRLRPGGILAQWFHLYNMPKDDLQSWLRAFVEIFPSSILWQLNDGDVLATGFEDGLSMRRPDVSGVPPAAASDLAGVGVHDPRLLLNLYVMRDDDLHRFAGSAAPNTDDNAILEYHGQRDLHAQTDLSNADDLDAFPKRQAPPTAVDGLRARLNSSQLMEEAEMFERAESLRSAFHSYQFAFHIVSGSNTKSSDALAGMDRTARRPEERAAVALLLGFPAGEDNLQNRTQRALEKARSGDLIGAQFLLEETAAAHPLDSAARFNYGLFCLERADYASAIEQFKSALDLNPDYLPAYEAIAETYLRLHDLSNAAIWSRRILQLEPNHEVARRTLEALEARGSR